MEMIERYHGFEHWALTGAAILSMLCHEETNFVAFDHLASGEVAVTTCAYENAGGSNVCVEVTALTLPAW